MIRKTNLINALFLIGFTVFGIGNFVGFKLGLATGMVVSCLPFLAIIAFFLIDAIYRPHAHYMLTRTYWLSMLYIGTLMFSMVVGLREGIPGVNLGNVVLSCVVFAAPFNAAVVVQYYNRDNDAFDQSRLLLGALGLLMLVNVLGNLAGIQPVGYSIEGRSNYPFMLGTYTAAHVLAVTSLMLLFHLRAPLKAPIHFFGVVLALLVSFVMMVQINSRLSLMIFLLLAIMFLTKAIKVVRGIYTISLFTMPLLLSFSLLVYQILSLPFFTAILQRVSKEDVTTFNGRSYIWNAVADWAWSDRRGLLFGNGYKGHYKLHMLDRVAELWDQPFAYNLHTHSTFTEVLVCQGVFGVSLLYILLWRGFKYYRTQYFQRSRSAPIFGGLVYLLFIWQIDIICYGVGMGHAILFTMLAPLAIDQRFISRREKDLDGQWLT